MSVRLQRLRKACEQRDAKALVRELKTVVPDYTVSKNVMERAFTGSLLNLDRVLHLSPAYAEALAANGHSRH